eukprot:4429160-Amphidinium_carterae.1
MVHAWNPSNNDATHPSKARPQTSGKQETDDNDMTRSGRTLTVISLPPMLGPASLTVRQCTPTVIALMQEGQRDRCPLRVPPRGQRTKTIQ